MACLWAAVIGHYLVAIVPHGLDKDVDRLKRSHMQRPLPFLRPQFPGAQPIMVARNTTTSIGRGDAGLTDGRVSRIHLRVHHSEEMPTMLRLECSGTNGCQVLSGSGSDRKIQTLALDSEAVTLYDQDEIYLLPGKYKFSVEIPDVDEGAGAAKRARIEQMGSSAGFRHSDTDTVSDGSQFLGDDWEAMKCGVYVVPQRPDGPADLSALMKLAMKPEAAEEGKIYLLTREFVVAYDIFPKAQVHLLILPRGLQLDGPHHLRVSARAAQQQCSATRQTPQRVFSTRNSGSGGWRKRCSRRRHGCTGRSGRRSRSAS